MRNAAQFLIEKGIPEETWLTAIATLRLLKAAQSPANSPSDKPKTGVLERRQLLAGGSNDTVLQWLMEAKLVEHQVETTRSGAKQRKFRASVSRRFGPRSCFVLTVSGFAVVWSVSAEARTLGHRDSTPAQSQGTAAEQPMMPLWKPASRQLSVGALVLHEFPRRAVNQMRVLIVFQEDNWAERIDNPLPDTEEGTAGKHLKDVVARLNRCQRVKMLHFRFHTDDDGESVSWEWVPSPR
jgi:hypothetical protein